MNFNKFSQQNRNVEATNTVAEPVAMNVNLPGNNRTNTHTLSSIETNMADRSRVSHCHYLSSFLPASPTQALPYVQMGSNGACGVLTLTLHNVHGLGGTSVCEGDGMTFSVSVSRNYEGSAKFRRISIDIFRDSRAYLECASLAQNWCCFFLSVLVSCEDL